MTTVFLPDALSLKTIVSCNIMAIISTKEVTRIFILQSYVMEASFLVLSYLDLQSAGMIIYFILSGGKQPVGVDSRDVAWSLSRRQFRKENISEEAVHLVSTMVSLNKAERPATSEALR